MAGAHLAALDRAGSYQHKLSTSSITSASANAWSASGEFLASGMLLHERGQYVVPDPGPVRAARTRAGRKYCAARLRE